MFGRQRAPSIESRDWIAVPAERDTGRWPMATHNARNDMEKNMTGNWEGSDRKERLPKSWPGLCATVKNRDNNRCTWRGDDEGDGLDRHSRRCWKRGTEVDHIVAGDDHRLKNLRTLCKGHHRIKSSREGNAAQAKPPATREPEAHPGRAK